MPTYEYRCPDGHTFDLFQKMSDEPGADCPECGKPAERQFSAGAGFLFKGDGFYITDYRSESYKKAASAESGGAGSDGASGGSKGDTSSGSSSGSSSSGGPSGGGSSSGSSDA